MSFAATPSRGRIVGAIAAVAVQAGLLFVLLGGLTVELPRRLANDLVLFAPTRSPPPPPRPRPVPHREHSHRREGAASPPNLRAQATEVVTPPPVVLLPPPPPVVVAAPVPGVGSADHAGASAVVGPGTGSGGVGQGTGNGRRGDGDGDGGDDTPPRQRGGRISKRDYPQSLFEAGIGGTVEVRYAVEVDGRATGCTVTRSSGHPLLDATTCRLIEQRFRFRPSRDRRGNPVRSFIVQRHSWETGREGNDEADEGDPDD